jgi:hypothetical protein
MVDGSGSPGLQPSVADRLKSIHIVLSLLIRPLVGNALAAADRVEKQLLTDPEQLYWSPATRSLLDGTAKAGDNQAEPSSGVV